MRELLAQGSSPSVLTDGEEPHTLRKEESRLQPRRIPVLFVFVQAAHCASIVTGAMDVTQFAITATNVAMPAVTVIK